MTLGRIFIVLVVLISSLVPVFSRGLQALEWNAFQVSAIRGLVGAVILGIIFNYRIAEAKKDWLGVLSASVAVLLTQTSYIYSTQHASIGIVIAILYLGPVWVVLYERFVLKNRNKRDGIACAFGFIGTLLVATSFDWHANTEVKGIIAAFIGSLGFTWFVIASKRTTSKVSPEIIAFWSCVVVSIILGWSLSGAAWTIPAFKWSMIFGIMNGAIYFILYFSAIKLIPSASEVSVWVYLEVAIVWLIGIFVYHEAIQTTSLLGTIFIVIAGLILAKRKKE